MHDSCRVSRGYWRHVIFFHDQRGVPFPRISPSSPRVGEGLIPSSLLAATAGVERKQPGRILEPECAMEGTRGYRTLSEMGGIPPPLILTDLFGRLQNLVYIGWMGRIQEATSPHLLFKNSQSTKTLTIIMFVFLIYGSLRLSSPRHGVQCGSGGTRRVPKTEQNPAFVGSKSEILKTNLSTHALNHASMCVTKIVVVSEPGPDLTAGTVCRVLVSYLAEAKDRTVRRMPTAESGAIFKNFICVLFGKPYKVLHFDMWSFAPLGSHSSRAR